MTEEQLLAATDAATLELHHKTIEDVQRETATTWAGRAAAAYHLYVQSGQLRFLLDAGSTTTRPSNTPRSSRATLG